MRHNHAAPRPNLNPKALPTLALAGRAVLTFRNIEKGTHFTVRIRQKRDKKDRKIKLPAYNVEISLLQDGVQRYRYAGMIFTDEPQIRIWIARELNPVRPNDARLIEVFRWMIRAIQNPEILRGRVGLFHEGRCCHCSMPLTHPESVYTGLGPVCLKHMEAQLTRENVRIAEVFAPVEQI